MLFVSQYSIPGKGGNGLPTINTSLLSDTANFKACNLVAGAVSAYCFQAFKEVSNALPAFSSEEGISLMLILWSVFPGSAATGGSILINSIKGCHCKSFSVS